MFKDVFVLKRSSWHARLMKYVWNFKLEDFTHMCPYFWLSVFNCLIFVFVFIYKEAIIRVFKYIGLFLQVLKNT